MKRNISKRENRIIARGEVSGHSHIVTGDCSIEEKDGEVYIQAGKNCAIKHLLEKPYIDEGLEITTKEHGELPLQAGNTYKYVQQVEYNPYEKIIQKVKD